MSTKLYVGNLSFPNHQSGSSGSVCSSRHGGVCKPHGGPQHGPIARICFCSDGYEPKNLTTIDQFNGKELGGRVLKVNEARPRENRPGGGGGGRGPEAATGEVASAVIAAGADRGLVVTAAAVNREPRW